MYLSSVDLALAYDLGQDFWGKLKSKGLLEILLIFFSCHCSKVTYDINHTTVKSYNKHLC